MGSKKTKKRKTSNRRQAASSPAKSSRVRLVIIALLIVLIAAVGLAAGAGVWKLTSGTADDGGGKLSDSVKFPSFASAPGTPYGSLKGYKAAVDYYDDMSHIPCFCGCGQHSGHKSVRDCFIDSRNGDNFLFDNHAAG